MMRVRQALAALAVLLMVSLHSGAMAQAAPDALGTWHGAVATPPGDLTLILYVTRGEQGAIKAELESPDQSPGRIPISSFTSADGRLAFKIDAIGAAYEGRWAEAQREWQGTFTQSGMGMKLNLMRGLPPPKPRVEGLDGAWEGVIERNGAKLRQVLRIATGEQGTRVQYDSPDQLVTGLPVKDMVRDGQKVRFSIRRGVATFEGTLSADKTQLAGAWTSASQPPIPVTFKRGQGMASSRPPKRPQTPKGPFPYRVEDVAFDNPASAPVHLAGTLTLPRGKGPFPAAVLITGSGPQDRDETLMGHKPFAVIADYLTRHGIAVLRCDDRGVGTSTGDYGAATSADLATDANAAFAYLRTRSEVRKDAIGFIGHSEGGMIGPIAMASNKDVAFIVLLAGPGTALDRLLLSQRRLIGAQMGLSEAEMNRAEPVMAGIFHAIARADTPEAGLAAARAVLTPEAISALGLPPSFDKELLMRQFSSPWFRYFLRYDPAPNLRRITVPVLALNGGLDRQVPASENLPAIREALKANRDATIMQLPGLNHLFQTAIAGGVGEYQGIEETMAPVVLQTMAAWINKRFGGK
jgi:uncharacterized protein